MSIRFTNFFNNYHVTCCHSQASLIYLGNARVSIKYNRSDFVPIYGKLPIILYTINLKMVGLINLHF